MGDRGDFEVPEDIYKGGGYRPQLTRPDDTPLTFNDFKSQSPLIRATAYATLAFALMADPESLSEDELLLLGYGMLVEDDLQDAYAEVPEFEGVFTDLNLFLQSGMAGFDERFKPIVHDQSILDAGDVIYRWDRLPPERLQIPVTTLGIILGVKAAVASATIGPLITTKLPLLHGGGSAAATKAAVLAGAMRISGNPGFLGKIASGLATAGRMTYGAGVGASIVSAALVPSSLFLTAVSNYLQGDEHQTQEDIQRTLGDAATLYAESTQVQGGPQGQPTPGSPAVQGIQASPGAPPEWFVATPPGINYQLGPVPPGSPLDPNADLFEEIPGFAEAAYEDDPSVRVPFGWPQRDQAPFISQQFQERREYPESFPSYRRSDIQEILANLSISQLIRLQDLAVRSGLLDNPEGGLPNFLPGARDLRTQQALEIFMGQANIDQDYSWWATAGRMAKLGDEAKAAAEADLEANRPRYVKNPFWKVDEASIRQAVDFQMERELGRPVNDWEWTNFLNTWQQNDRRRYEQVEAGNRSLFEAQYREGQTQTTQAAGTFQTVDPQARFDEQFQAMFKGELSRKKRTEQVQGMTGNLMRSLSNAEAAVTR